MGKKSAPSSSEEDDSDSELELEMRALAESQASRNAVAEEPKRKGPKGINDEPALIQAREDIARNFPWVETLHVTSVAPSIVPDVHDDIQRELALYLSSLQVVFLLIFLPYPRSNLNIVICSMCSYNQGLSAVVEARDRLNELGVPYKRPTDYYAEMLKSDDHMRRVKCVVLLLDSPI